MLMAATRGTFQVVRVGRKRKSGRRHPNGKLAIARDLDVVTIAKFHPDRQGLPAEKRHDQKAGTPLGRLNLAGQITDDQMEAARLYARDVRAFQQVIGCPSSDAPSLDPATAGIRAAPIAFSPEEIKRRRNNYDAAFHAVIDAGHRPAKAVARVAVYGEWLPLGTTIEHLKLGLSTLADHYGLTSRKKSATKMQSEQSRS